MPTVQAERLQEIAAELLKGAGASDEEATIVSKHSIGANLAGHDRAVNQLEHLVSSIEVSPHDLAVVR